MKNSISTQIQAVFIVSTHGVLETFARKVPDHEHLFFSTANKIVITKELTI